MADQDKAAAREAQKLASDALAKEPFAYLAIKKTDESLARPFATGNEEYVKKVVERWGLGEEPKAETDEVEEPESPPETTHEATLNEALKKAVAFACSQAHLISATSITPLLLEHVNLTTNVFGPVIDKCAPVQDDDVAAIYALDQDLYEKVDKERRNLLDFRMGLAALPNATLMSLVATFDALVVDLLAKMLRLNKSWMAKSDRKLDFSKIADVESLDELISEAVGDEIYQFSRGSHDEQAKYLETNFGVAIRSHWKRWPDYIEVFERRNLIAHGEATFNKRYVSICSSSGHKGSAKLLNDKVEVRSTYLRQALDILTEFAILLPFSVWRKVSDEDEEKAFLQINEAAYSLILDDRFVVAERILDFALTLTKVKVPVSVIQTLTINRASALRHAGSIDQANAALDGVDWSASSDLFQICMHAVRGNADEVAKLLPNFAKSEKLNAPTFKQWPCFGFVRDDDAVKHSFLATFGEPLSVPARQTPAISPASDTDQSSELKTVH